MLRNLARSIGLKDRNLADSGPSAAPGGSQVAQPSAGHADVGRIPTSRLCTQKELESPEFERLGNILREPHLFMHRKLWEWCFITRVLEEQGMLAAGRRGLGFAVGREPLVAHFAAGGASILASDLDMNRAADAGWVASGEHAASLSALNERGLCPEDVFERSVQFREVNMLDIPVSELSGFDFLWSSCAFEHLGSLDAGLGFVLKAMDCLRPGGLAIHTTEFNVGSNDATIADGGTVIYRRQDIERLATQLSDLGHEVRLDFAMGTQPLDYDVDVPPYTHDHHLKLHLMGYTTTSIGIVIRRCG
jgi:hypothetical protein